MTAALLLAPSYLGPDHLEGRLAEQRARASGMSALRARIVGHVASFRDCWTFRRTMAEREKCSVRTVQRALTEAREEGLIGVARAKPNEVPPGLKTPMACGWSHRWIIGRGLAVAAALAAVAAAKAAALVRRATRSKPERAARAPLSQADLAARRELLRAQAAQLLAEEPDPPPD